MADPPSPVSLEQKSLTRQKKKHAKNASLSPSVVTAAPSDDGSSVHKPDSDLAMLIQPLLEQVRQAQPDYSPMNTIADRLYFIPLAGGPTRVVHQGGRVAPQV